MGQNGEYDNKVSISSVVNDKEINSKDNDTTAVSTAIHLTYDINFDDDDDLIIQAATQLVIANGQHQFAVCNENSNDNDYVWSLNSFVLFDNPRYAGDKQPNEIPIKETRKQKKERQEKWRNMKDYGIIHHQKLAKHIETYMLCKCCVAEIIKGGNLSTWMLVS